MPEETRPVRPSLLANLSWLLLGSLALYVGSFLMIMADEYFLQTYWLVQYCPWYAELGDYVRVFYWPLIWLVLTYGGI